MNAWRVAETVASNARKMAHTIFLAQRPTTTAARPYSTILRQLQRAFENVGPNNNLHNVITQMKMQKKKYLLYILY